jgi:hypothetical protein
MLPLVANSDTTENLLNQDFSTWSGTNKARHGNDTVAGVHGQYVESTISLNNDAGLSKEVINNGFTSTLGADIWFWNSLEQNVTITQTLTDDNGNVTTQSRTIDNDGCYFCTHTDSIIVDKNSQQDYNITVKYSFEESSQSAYHVGADIKNPTLYIEYDPVVIDATTQSEIAEIYEDIVEVTFEPDFEVSSYNEPIINEVVIEETFVETFEEPTVEEQFIEDTIVLSNEIIEEEIYEEEVVEETERDTRVGEDTGGAVETESAGVSESTQDNSRSFETELTIEEISIKVAEKIKTIDGQLKAVQILTAKAMQKPSKINKYAQVNSDIFIQPELQSIDIGTYTNSTYVDIRDIYPNQTYEDRLWTSR